MTYKQAVKKFRDNILPLVKAAYERDFSTDMPARQRSWRAWVGALVADETITVEQYGRWENPYGGEVRLQMGIENEMLEKALGLLRGDATIMGICATPVTVVYDLLMRTVELEARVEELAEVIDSLHSIHQRQIAPD
jgi:hypothetical protein